MQSLSCPFQPLDFLLFCLQMKKTRCFILAEKQARPQEELRVSSLGTERQGQPLLSVFQALMSLFVLSSKDGWVNIMYDGLDAVGIDQQVPVLQSPAVLLSRASGLGNLGFFESQEGAEL